MEAKCQVIRPKDARQFRQRSVSVLPLSDPTQRLAASRHVEYPEASAATRPPPELVLSPNTNERLAAAKRAQDELIDNVRAEALAMRERQYEKLRTIRRFRKTAAREKREREETLHQQQMGNFEQILLEFETRRAIEEEERIAEVARRDSIRESMTQMRDEAARQRQVEEDRRFAEYMEVAARVAEVEIRAQEESEERERIRRGRLRECAVCMEENDMGYMIQAPCVHWYCYEDLQNLKLDNIMVTFEDPSVIEAFVQGQLKHPMARKRVGTRTVYRCHNDFGGLHNAEALGKMYPKITDLGLAQRGDGPGPLLHPIQPNGCHAPEVLLGTGWSYSAGIWNFGIMVWKLLAGRGLFEQGNLNPYSAVQHLADMIALIGPAPSVLIQREKDRRQWRWNPQVFNSSSKLCGNAAEFYGGPFFTDDGTFIGNQLVPHTRIWENEVPECIPREETDQFFKFMRRMICWLPEKRATARELKSDPWFDNITRT
ncbi:hypothetical protein GQX73_g3030 [Xylaria multiplex]|uniref:Protein kinase domain-containing protein n=1 Tax=Xylaria multiplex TaxID=323545 RepID=A0A7C8MU95_9PEZI|nr:hypothetical protein GQX73_g3030 [Xylaria multiplex]